MEMEEDASKTKDGGLPNAWCQTLESMRETKGFTERPTWRYALHHQNETKEDMKKTKHCSSVKAKPNDMV